MGRQAAKDAYLAILEDSEGKTKEEAQEATLALIDIIADLIEEGAIKTKVDTTVNTTVVTNAPATGTGTGAGAQVDAPGTIEIPS